MANEIRVTAGLTCTNGLLKLDFPQKSIQVTQATGEAGLTTWEVGTSEEDFSFGDVVPGYVVMYNMDSTNYVDWGMSDGGTMKAIGRLKAGGIALFEIKASATLRAQANTAACKVQIGFWNV